MMQPMPSDSRRTWVSASLAVLIPAYGGLAAELQRAAPERAPPPPQVE